MSRIRPKLDELNRRVEKERAFQRQRELRERIDKGRQWLSGLTPQDESFERGLAKLRKLEAEYRALLVDLIIPHYFAQVLFMIERDSSQWRAWLEPGDCGQLAVNFVGADQVLRASWTLNLPGGEDVPANEVPVTVADAITRQFVAV